MRTIRVKPNLYLHLRRVSDLGTRRRECRKDDQTVKQIGAEDLQSAMKRFDVEVKSHDKTSTEVAVRWIAHHSALNDGDGIILGVGKTEQIRETVMMIRKGPLSGKVLELAESIWGELKSSRGHII